MHGLCYWRFWSRRIPSWVAPIHRIMPSHCQAETLVAGTGGQRQETGLMPSFWGVWTIWHGLRCCSTVMARRQSGALSWSVASVWFLLPCWEPLAWSSQILTPGPYGPGQQIHGYVHSGLRSPWASLPCATAATPWDQDESYAGKSRW